MSVASDMVDDLFEDDALTEAAVYTPSGGAAVSLRVIARRTDENTRFGDGGFQSAATSIEFRAADIAQPRKGDAITMNAVNYVVQADPVADVEGVLWRCLLRKA